MTKKKNSLIGGDMFLLTLDKKGEIVIVPYPKKRVWDKIINKRNKKGDKYSIW